VTNPLSQWKIAATRNSACYMGGYKLKKEQGNWRRSFTAMASPCEVLMEVEDHSIAKKILDTVSNEALRIENKFSRYRNDNIVYKINNAVGKTVAVDDETARLIDFADELHQLSDGLFDITSGVLRKAWRFDGSDRIPKKSAVSGLLARVGWQKVKWKANELVLKPGMEIDLGGIGKEYAVDRCVKLVQNLTDASVLVNFGGDLATTGERPARGYWSVGRLITGKEQAVALFQLYRGAIATSGDANRYLLKNGVRYSHVLNPKNGWPVPDAPHTVSVALPTCTEAGMMSTLAMLQGSQAEDFLKLQAVEYWLD
jgi:thiamine biosynthesis lipoprotein